MSAVLTDAPSPFASALRHGVSAIWVVLTFLFFVVAPSNDVRARVPFLILLTPAALLISWTTAALIALAAIAGAARLSKQAIAGAAVASTLGHFFVLSGVAVRLLPEIESRSLGWLAGILATVAYLVALVRERHRSSHKGRLA
jgi:hypothetical protein